MALTIDISDVKKNSMQEHEHNGKKYLVVNLDDKYYVLNGKCTHLGCKLAKGKLENNIIICPCHGSQFDAMSGKVLKWIPNWGKILSSVTKKVGLARDLKFYNSKIEGTDLLIELE